MNKLFGHILLVVVAVGLMAGDGLAQTGRKLKIHHQDAFEIVFSKLKGQPDTVFAFGSVILETETGAMIYCDTAVYALDETAWLRGRVLIESEDQRLAADDSVIYDAATRRIQAYGKYVELYSAKDSMLATGTYAFFDSDRNYFYMTDRPTVHLNYPDSANLTEVVADVLEYDAGDRSAEAQGNVTIQGRDILARSGCAIARPQRHLLDLYDQPVLERKQSRTSGGFISILSDGGVIRGVDVIDSAVAEFTEPADSAGTKFDKSTLRGQRLAMGFEYGQLKEVTCRGQAYSWYNPGADSGGEVIENEVSGDSIHFTVANDELIQVDVVGGAMGTYLSSRPVQKDSTTTIVTDTVDYQAYRITYNLPDSLITLRVGAQTVSGTMSLDAFQIAMDTKERIIEAFSGAVGEDTITYANMFAKQLQPKEIPVVLKDAQENLSGDYLRYSIDTKKGRIVTSKSQYETGYFYGRDLYRQKENVYYLEECRYTSCDAAEPHFHFRSHHIKLLEGNRLIAKPLYLYVGRLPVFALPYYVFPMQKGRHSGILPFSFGNFERGERYVKNVGYYWAASDHWDWQGALDYYDVSNRLNFNSQVQYKKLYAFDGYLKGTWGRASMYNRKAGVEYTTSRWTLNGAHNQTVTPTFKLSSTVSAQSDATYYQDYSSNLDDRLKRTLTSKVSFAKKFGASTSVSGEFTHDNQLDARTRTDRLPSLNVSLPPIHPFGVGSRNEDGDMETHWYNALVATYRPTLLNYSKRTTKDSLIDQVWVIDSIVPDTVIVVTDTLTGRSDTTIRYDTTLALVSEDTLAIKSRQKWSRIDHSVSLSFPMKLVRYIDVNPNVSYSESWYRIYETDVSRKQGIDAHTTYRTYTARAGVSLSTSVYGTVHPNVLGLIGLRQVLTPSIGYGYTPYIRRHPEISSYAGGTSGSTARSQAMTVSLKQVYQAKVKQNEAEKTAELVTISSSFRYDFEAKNRRFSDLSTEFSSTLLKKVSFYGSATHSFYKLGTNEVDFWHPRLERFDTKMGLNLAGRTFVFDETGKAIPRGEDSASHVSASPQPSSTGAGTGWSLGLSYSFSETGLGTKYYDRDSEIRATLRFNLTPSTRVDYSQYYSFDRKKTINNQVTITRQLHCWTGVLTWVPIGSNRGWSFSLAVTAIPAIKIDKDMSRFSSTALLRSY